MILWNLLKHCALFITVQFTEQIYIAIKNTNTSINCQYTQYTQLLVEIDSDSTKQLFGNITQLESLLKCVFMCICLQHFQSSITPQGS